MKTSTFLILTLLTSAAWAQQSEPLLFNEKIHNFGDIQETKGVADTEFTFINNSGRTIKILSVQASCGCTTPGWTAEPILSGKSGFIKASYNPAGRPGFFNKTLTVSTDLNRDPIVLQIKGNVTTEEILNDNTRLTKSNGNLKFRSATINFGKVYINRAPALQEVALFNAGEVPIHISSVVAPNYIKIEAPETIEPNTRGTLKLWFNAILKNQYGFLSDNIELVTDDPESPSKSFPVYATVEEYFLPVGSDDLDKIPVLMLEMAAVDFGVIREGATVQREVKVLNAGKKELTIRAVQANCVCMTAGVGETKLKPGQESKIKIEWKGEGKRGAQQKAVTLYSTDPVTPVQRIIVAASVN